MKRALLSIASLLQLPLPALADEASLLLFGASVHHDCRNCRLNQNNPGAGLEWAFAGGDAGGRWFGRIGSYRDSFRQHAYFAALGWRREWAVAGPLSAGIGLQAGYLHGSGRHGPAALPLFSLGTRAMALEVGHLPKVSIGAGRPKTAVTTLNLRWTF